MARKLFLIFCLITVITILIRSHLIKISTSRFQLFTVNYHFKVNYSKQNSFARDSMSQQALKRASPHPHPKGEALRTPKASGASPQDKAHNEVTTQAFPGATVGKCS